MNKNSISYMINCIIEILTMIFGIIMLIFAVVLGGIAESIINITERMKGGKNERYQKTAGTGKR